MNDIVERLRKRRDVVLGADTDCAEAADEIERLREALKLYACNCTPPVCEAEVWREGIVCGLQARAALAEQDK